MSATVEKNLTLFEHVMWVVDNANVAARPHVADDGTVTPNAAANRILHQNATGMVAVDAEPGVNEATSVPLVELLEQAVRPDKRGVSRVGLTARLWLALFIAAGAEGQNKITSMHAFATGDLPRETQWELDILTRDGKTGKVRTLTAKQLYTFTENIARYLDTDPKFNLAEAETARRNTIVDAITDALVTATHVVPRVGSSYAVDESGVWAWTKAKHTAPKGLSLANPCDLDVYTGIEPDEKTGPEEPDPEEIKPDIRLDEQWDQETDDDEDQAEPDNVPDLSAGEPDLAESRAESTEEGAKQSTPDPGGASEEPDSDQQENKQKRRGPKPCWFAQWGAKTHKTGRRSSYYGYGLHAIVRVADIIKGGGKGARTNPYAEPRLVEQFALTPASTDIVDVTLGMVKTILGRGQKITDLLGDRHYSYKKFERWVSKLWSLGIRQVLDLRQTDLGPVNYNGAIILAGTPHLGVPEALWSIERPGPGVSPEQIKNFEKRIEERQKYAMTRITTAWANGDGKSRWTSPARTGTVGCPHIDGSVQIAVANGLPVLTPDSHAEKWCTQQTVLIPAGKHMKHQQEEYWGSPNWIASFNRRTFIESVFGVMKSHHTGNIRRGFMCLSGRALVTLTMASAIVNYNLRELESWHKRARKYEKAYPESRHNPLLDIYQNHPLHQKTHNTFGHTMLTAKTQAELDNRCAPTQVTTIGHAARDDNELSQAA